MTAGSPCRDQKAAGKDHKLGIRHPRCASQCSLEERNQQNESVTEVGIGAAYVAQAGSSNSGCLYAEEAENAAAVQS